MLPKAASASISYSVCAVLAYCTIIDNYMRLSIMTYDYMPPQSLREHNCYVFSLFRLPCHALMWPIAMV